MFRHGRGVNTLSIIVVTRTLARIARRRPIMALVMVFLALTRLSEEPRARI